MKKSFLILFFGIFMGVDSCSVDDGTDLVVPSSTNRCSDGTERIVGIGPIITQTLSLEDFHSIVSLQGINVRISQGMEQRVSATGHANIIDRIRPVIAEGTWAVVLGKGCYADVNLSIDISVPTLQKLTSKASGNIDVFGFQGLDEVEINSMGSGSITVHAGIDQLTNLKIDNRGSGELRLYPMEAANCTIFSAGTGNTFVTVQDSLKVDLRGSGNVTYKGSPVIEQMITGSGVLNHAN